MLLALLLLADAPPPTPATIQTHDLGKLTWRQAQQLSGQPVRVSFVVSSLATDLDGCVVVDAQSVAGVSATVLLGRVRQPEQMKIGGCFTVEGQLVTQVFRASMLDGERFKLVNSVEIRGARLVRLP